MRTALVARPLPRAARTPLPGTATPTLTSSARPKSAGTTWDPHWESHIHVHVDADSGRREGTVI